MSPDIKSLSILEKQRLLQALEQQVSPGKRRRMAAVLQERTRYLSVVLENIYQPHNASAAIRSCEALGVQDVHIIEEVNPFRPNTDIVMGAAQWVTIKRYHDQATTHACLARLKAQGYRIAAMTLRQGSISLRDVPLDRKLALCFGAEEVGLSDEAHDLADVWVNIPIMGFTRSFNVSVAVAVAVYELSRRLRATTVKWRLSADEQLDLKIKWILAGLERSDLVLARLLEQIA